MPDQPAVVCGETILTYRVLDEKANQIANVLRSEGVGKDDVVGIMLNRSAEVAAAILGVMKSGGAFCRLIRKCRRAGCNICWKTAESAGS